MCQYRRICQNRQFFLRFISQITLWTSWMTSFSWFNFPNLLFSTFTWLGLMDYKILRILMIHFNRTYCETPYKIKQKCLTYDVISNAYAFLYFLKKTIIFVSIWPNVPILPKFFGKKLSAIFGPLPVFCLLNTFQNIRNRVLKGLPPPWARFE